MKSDVLEFPEVAIAEHEQELPPHIQRVFRLHEEKKWFSSKYWKTQKRLIEETVETLFQENPTLPIKQVVIQILSDLPDFLPSWNIHRVTGYVTQTWRELSKADEAPAPEPKEAA